MYSIKIYYKLNTKIPQELYPRVTCFTFEDNFLVLYTKTTKIFITLDSILKIEKENYE